MAKRKAGRPRKFEILPILKTEPIYVETPSPVFKIRTIPGIEENDILFKCDECGKPGSYLLESGYKLVKTAALVEVVTQTGSDEITVDPVKIEEEVDSSENNMTLGRTDDTLSDSSEEEEKQNFNSTELPVSQSQIIPRQSIVGELWEGINSTLGIHWVKIPIDKF